MIYRLEEPTGVVHWVSDRDAHDAHYNTYQLLKAKNHPASFQEMFSDVMLVRGFDREQTFSFGRGNLTKFITLPIEEWEAIYSVCGFVYIMTEQYSAKKGL